MDCYEVLDDALELLRRRGSVTLTEIELDDLTEGSP